MLKIILILIIMPKLIICNELIFSELWSFLGIWGIFSDNDHGGTF